MKHCKYFFIYVVAAFTVLIATSCRKNFLDPTLASTAIPTEQYITDLQTTGNVLNGVYVRLASEFYPYGATVYPDLIADNVKLGTATSSTLSAQYYWTMSPSTVSGNSGNMNKAWHAGYLIIRHCNLVLENAEKYKDQDISKANNLKAQAYGIRALLHFFMVNIFAQSYGFTADASHPGIPYVTIYDWTQPVKRIAVGEVYANMINDLATAIPLFNGPPSAFFMNRNAANALLARIYLYKGDYQSAKNLATEVTRAVPLMAASSTGYPSKLFTDSDKEALFQLPPSQSNITLPSPTGTYTGTYTSNFQGRGYISPKAFVATADLAVMLAQSYSSDARKAWVQASGGLWNVTKFPVGVVAGFSIPSLSYYESVIRSSEMYLTAAESYARLNNDDSARHFVNAIRTRAGIPALPVTISGTSLLDSICNERRKELAFEGLRMWDLQRWKKGVSRNDTWSQTSAKNLPYPSNSAIAPIPQPDVEAYGLPQNIGY